VIGVAGALLGGWTATKLFRVVTLHGFFNLSTWLTAIAGSAVLLLAYHLVTSRKHRPHPAPARLGTPVNGLIQPTGGRRVLSTGFIAALHGRDLAEATRWRRAGFR
jgi:hypothetical protein